MTPSRARRQAPGGGGDPTLPPVGQPPGWRAALDAALDPVDRFSEVVHGLIIALSVTGSLSVGTGATRSIRLLLTGVLAANIASSLPAALPFLLLRNAKVALRVSHAVAIVLLFLGGSALGRYAGLGPFRTGLATMGIGVVLFLLTIGLGG